MIFSRERKKDNVIVSSLLESRLKFGLRYRPLYSIVSPDCIEQRPMNNAYVKRLHHKERVGLKINVCSKFAYL